MLSVNELVDIATKYTSQHDFKQQDHNAYVQAKRQGFLTELCEHMESLEDYCHRTKQKIKKE